MFAEQTQKACSSAIVASEQELPCSSNESAELGQCHRLFFPPGRTLGFASTDGRRP